jgi:chromosome segregation ATPase
MRLIVRLWRRNRALRRQLLELRAQLDESLRRISELQAQLERSEAAHNDEVARLAQQVNESDTRAAAEHYRAFTLQHNFNVQQLELNAMRTERDLAFERARKLAARIQQLEAERTSAPQ